MQSSPWSLPLQLAILLILLVGVLTLIGVTAPIPTAILPIATSTQPAASGAFTIATTTQASTTSVAKATTTRVIKPTSGPTKKALPVSRDTPANPNTVSRVLNPYATAPLPFETINSIARAASVNIFCASRNGGLRPISGSGAFIDSSGVILTNAHVAQYVLLAQSGKVDMYCHIRSGMPASARWIPQVMYIPPIWVEEHAVDISKSRPVGTGKHDYALLYVVSAIDGSPAPTRSPALSYDAREGIGFIGDTVLAASYPAEFLGATVTNFNLYPVTSISEIDDLFTLGIGTVDVISIGGVIGAQSGSSGGAIVNAWGRLIGVITTTSEGATTGERELRGITTSYISRDIESQSGFSLSLLLSGDPALQTAEFSARIVPGLVEKLLANLR